MPQPLDPLAFLRVAQVLAQEADEATLRTAIGRALLCTVSRGTRQDRGEEHTGGAHGGCECRQETAGVSGHSRPVGCAEKAAGHCRLSVAS